MYSVYGIAFNEAKILWLFKNVDVDLSPFVAGSIIYGPTPRFQAFKPSSFQAFKTREPCNYHITFIVRRTESPWSISFFSWF